MPFRVRDLIITVLPTTVDPGIFGECDAGSEVPPGPPPAPPPPGPDSVVLDSRLDFIELRLLVQIALAELGGPLSPEEMRPRSLADLNLLESKLEGALAEIRELRAHFGASGQSTPLAVAPAAPASAPSAIPTLPGIASGSGKTAPARVEQAAGQTGLLWVVPASVLAILLPLVNALLTPKNATPGASGVDLFVGPAAPVLVQLVLTGVLLVGIASLLFLAGRSAAKQSRSLGGGARSGLVTGVISGGLGSLAGVIVQQIHPTLLAQRDSGGMARSVLVGVAAFTLAGVMLGVVGALSSKHSS